MAKTEDIEAKLAAYVDGMLDDAGKADIEQHLVANPQHRKLLEDLVAQKKLIASLPREKAPADASETINAQLERAVLLDDVEEEVQAARSGHWSQTRAIAALVVLIFSLATVIYLLLPSSRQQAQIADIHALPASLPSRAPMSLEEDASEQGAQPFAAVMSEQERRARSALGGGGATTQPIEVVAAPTSEPTQIAQAPTTEPVNQIVIDVASSDTVRDAQTTVNFLDQQSVAWNATTANPTTSEAAALPATIPSQFRYTIRARQLTPTQVDSLRTLLASSQTAQGSMQSMSMGVMGSSGAEKPTTQPQLAESHEDRPFAGAKAATTEPEPRLLEAGDRVRIVIPQLSSPGLEADSEQAIDSSGAISVPMLEPILVAGLSEAAAQDLIAEKYRQAKLIEAATVKVEALSTPQTPTTQPNESLAMTGLQKVYVQTKEISTTQAMDEKFKSLSNDSIARKDVEIRFVSGTATTLPNTQTPAQSAPMQTPASQPSTLP